MTYGYQITTRTRYPFTTRQTTTRHQRKLRRLRKLRRVVHFLGFLAYWAVVLSASYLLTLAVMITAALLA